MGKVARLSKQIAEAVGGGYMEEEFVSSNHPFPIVKDFQLLSIVSLILLFASTELGLVGFGLLMIVVWDGFFWTTVFSVPLAILTPFFCIYLLYNQTTLMFIETDSFWRTIKRWVDSTTMPIWIAAFFFGVDLYNDRNFPLLFIIYWLFLPLNVLFYGIWTIIFFPVTVVFVYLTSTYYLDIYNTIVALIYELLAALLALF